MFVTTQIEPTRAPRKCWPVHTLDTVGIARNGQKCLETLNIEYRTGNRRMQKGVTSTFEIPCSTFCG